MRNVTVAALQTTSGDWQRATNIARIEKLVREAAARGAQVILIQELFELPYFCTDQLHAHFDLAQPFEGNATIAHFAALAKELGVVLPVSFFERANNACFNSVAMVDADGRVLGLYRKTHIPDGPGYSEKFYFTPGDTGFKVWETRFGKIGVGICWDQWFPECARAMALMGAEMLLYPTAIGSEPHDATLDSAAHWRRVMQGHAGANLMPVIAANRIGTEQGRTFSQTYYGTSFIADATGAIVAEANRTDEAILLHTFDLDALQTQRQSWGVFRDRCPSMYHVLATSDGQRQTAG